MAIDIAPPVRAQKPPSLPFLPREIRNEIYAHLLKVSRPISFNVQDGFKSDHLDGTIQQALDVIKSVPEAREIFYRHNSFRVNECDLQSFLNYTPGSQRERTCADPTPKAHVVQLYVYMTPDQYWPKHNPDPALRSLLECPRLSKVDVRLNGYRVEDVREYDRTFRQMTDVCIELGDRLGEKGLVVIADSCYDTRTWSVVDFRKSKARELEFPREVTDIDRWFEEQGAG